MGRIQPICPWAGRRNRLNPGRRSAASASMARNPRPTPADCAALLGAVEAEQVKRVAALGKKAWPYSFKAERTLAGLRARLEAKFQPGTKGNAPGEKRHKVAGRLRAKRGSGGIAFLDLEGQDGKIQAILDKSEMGEEAFTE